VFLQIVLGWFYCHIGEYFIHKNILHSRRKIFKNSFKFHFKNHHKNSRKDDMKEKKYGNQSLYDLFFDVEIRMLFLIGVIHFPIFLLFPYFYLAIVWSLFSYYFIHRITHTNVEFGKKYFPWHYDHHMGKNQHVNWGVRLPIFDYIMSTRLLSENSKNE